MDKDDKSLDLGSVKSDDAFRIAYNNIDGERRYNIDESALGFGGHGVNWLSLTGPEREKYIRKKLNDPDNVFLRTDNRGLL